MYTISTKKKEAKKNIFQLLSDPEQEILELNTVKINYKKSETVCKQGALASHVFYVIDGIAKVYKESENHKNLILRLARPGEFIGISELSGSAGLYSVSASSIMSMQVLLIEKNGFLKLIKENKAFAYEVIGHMAALLRYDQQKMVTLGNKQLHGRIADAVLYLDQVAGGRGIIDLGLSRRDIADLSGVSTESAIRILSEFKHDGIIKLQGKDIQLVKPDLLQKLSEIG